MSKVYIKNNSNFIEVNNFFRKIDNSWVEMTQSGFLTYLEGVIPIFGGIIPSITRFEIAAPNTLVAESCQCLATFNDTVLTSGVSWSIISGSSYASIDSNGLLTLTSTANNSNATIQATYSNYTDTHDLVVTYKSGATSETTTETIVDGSGNSITITTTITENEDGTTSSESTSIVYNQDGDPIEKTNESTDTSGNISTQEIEYDEDGNEVVTGYSIDTSNNPDGTKNFNGNGVNTEYYAFDLTHGFELHIHFTINYSQQPAGQNENHHNILTMKRANPSPWYGFQLRHSNTNKVIILGTQFATGSNTNKNLTGRSTGITNEQEFDLTITYNPTASSNKFVCRDNINNTNVYTSNLTFPDIEELRYLKVTIGHALDQNGDPYRYSNINVYDFNISRL